MRTVRAQPLASVRSTCAQRHTSERFVSRQSGHKRCSRDRARCRVIARRRPSTTSNQGNDMKLSEQKIVQYLGEAHAHERGQTRVLQSQIAMTPRGTYRNALETHLKETRDHARRIDRRLTELDAGASTLGSIVGA